MSSGNPYILLADDDPDDRDFFCAGMQRLHPEIKVFSFKDGDELLEFLSFRELSSLPTCIILDYNMPLFSAPQLLRATGPGSQYSKVPKVVWSTSELRKEVDECLHLGAVHFAFKPETEFQLDKLIKSMQQWLMGKTPH